MPEPGAQLDVPRRRAGVTLQDAAAGTLKPVPVKVIVVSTVPELLDKVTLAPVTVKGAVTVICSTCAALETIML